MKKKKYINKDKMIEDVDVDYLIALLKNKKIDDCIEKLYE